MKIVRKINMLALMGLLAAGSLYGGTDRRKLNGDKGKKPDKGKFSFEMAPRVGYMSNNGVCFREMKYSDQGSFVYRINDESEAEMGLISEINPGRDSEVDSWYEEISR